jgi:16S rRNA (adenine1518-N6/adenine1519-N6)-dimethyltransferase
MVTRKGRPPKESKGLAAELRESLDQLGLRPKKSLGQHFLIDPEVRHRILESAGLSAGDIVVEVGPGLGVLTKEMARLGCAVVAVEADSRLLPPLRQSLEPYPLCSVVHADILQTPPDNLLRGLDRSSRSYKVVADLPYYITSAVLRHFLTASAKPHRIVVMVQREVGEAIVAEPGKMSLLSVSVQFYGKPEIVGPVSAQSFHPPPKVDSVILRIDVFGQPAVGVPSEEDFFGVVRAGFSARRKQLRNALAQGLGVSTQEALDLLAEANLDPKGRAESLGLDEWARLCHVVAHRK